jgi:glutathione S-transferase
MKLFYMPGACSLAPHITLEWIGKPFEVIRIERGATKNPEYLKVNPLGKVPALILEDGNLLVEASAILLYLAEQNPEANLGFGDRSNSVSPDPASKYELHRWLSHFTGNVHPAFFPFFAPQRYTDNLEWHSAIREKSYDIIADQLTFLDNHLSDRDFMLGARQSILDPYLFVFLRWGKLLPTPLREYRNLYRFFEFMADNEGVKRALTEQRIEP